MAIPKHFLSLTLFLAFITTRVVHAQVEEAAVAAAAKTGLKIMTDWPSMGMPMYGDFEQTGDLFDIDEDDDDNDEMGDRRSLFWRRVHYYISYGALSANRIPCPPRSGRSYYTHNCFKSRTPVNPYTRGCSRITRCRR